MINRINKIEKNTGLKSDNYNGKHINKNHHQYNDENDNKNNDDAYLNYNDRVEQYQDDRNYVYEEMEGGDADYTGTDIHHFPII